MGRPPARQIPRSQTMVGTSDVRYFQDPWTLETYDFQDFQDCRKNKNHTYEISKIIENVGDFVVHYQHVPRKIYRAVQKSIVIPPKSIQLCTESPLLPPLGRVSHTCEHILVYSYFLKVQNEMYTYRLYPTEHISSRCDCVLQH